MQYLLPCACGHKLPVQISQAGQTVLCSCGKALDVPTMRGLRDLEVAAPLDGARPTRHWSTARGILFVVGVVLMLLATACGGWLTWQRGRLNTTQPTIDEEGVRQQVSEWTPTQTWDWWKFVRGRKLDRLPPAYLIARRIAFAIDVGRGIALTIGLLGLGMLIGSLIGRGTRVPPQQAT